MTWTWILGLDFGVTDPTAFTVVGWKQHSPVVYVVESYKVAGMIPSDAAAEIRKLSEQYEFERIVGDVGGLGKVFAEDLRRRYSLPIMPARKSDKLGHIDLLNGAMKEGLVKIIRSGCGQLLEELVNLQWAEGHLRKEMPGQQNHCVDSLLYSWRECRAYQEDAAPDRPPQPNTRAAYDAEHERMLQERIDMVNESNTRDWWDAD